MNGPDHPHAVVWSKGRILCLLAGGSFFALCILTPLAGPAAARTETAAASARLYLLAGLLSLMISGVAYRQCRREGILHGVSLGLCITPLLFILLHIFGFFR